MVAVLTHIGWFACGAACMAAAVLVTEFLFDKFYDDDE